MNKIKLISIATITTAMLATASYAKTGTVNVDEAVVRGGASTSTEIVAGIKRNTEVEITEEKDGFYGIKYNNINGYVRSDLLTVKEETTEETEPEQEQETQLEAEQTNLEVTVPEFPKEYSLESEVKIQLLPKFNSVIITTVGEGNNITINKQIGNWSYVTFENINGWIRNINLQINIEGKEEPVEEEKEEKNEEQAADIEKGYVSASSVNVRKEENTSSDILTSLTRNTEVKVLAISGNWYKIQYGDIVGYIMQEYISDKQEEVTSRSEEERENPVVETKSAYVSVNTANVRAQATTTSKRVKTLSKRTEVQVVGTEGDFSKIVLDNGETAYIATRLLVNSLDEIAVDPEPEAVSNSSENNNNNNVQVYNTTGSPSGEGIVEFAKQFLGYSYVYGGTTPSGGFDCSGFVYYVYNSCGHSISRSCSTQASQGTAVEKSDLQLGDLVFFNNTSSGAIGHVGIYIGDGRFIHASNPTRGVVTDTLNSGYYNTYYYSARRIVE